MDDTQPPGDRGRPTVPARALRKVPPPQTQVARRKPGSREGRQGRRHDTAAAEDDARRAGRRGRWRRMRRGPDVDLDGETATPHRSKSKSAPSGARSDAQSNAVGTEGGLRRSPGRWSPFSGTATFRERGRVMALEQLRVEEHAAGGRRRPDSRLGGISQNCTERDTRGPSRTRGTRSGSPTSPPTRAWTRWGLVAPTYELVDIDQVRR